MDLSIVVVSWNVCELLRRCLRSIAAQTGGAPPDAAALSTEVWVVDNASADGTLDMLRAEYPGVRVIANSENVGFTRANNLALAQAQGRYLFLLNPDTELGPGALSALTAYLDANPRIGIAGPRLVYADGSPQSSRRRFPTLATFFLESTKLQQWFPRHRVLTRYYMLDTPDDEVQPVDWVNGAALFVRRQVYDQIGGFDEAFFMYSEELDWCCRAKRAGWQIAYFPSAQVTHHEAKSSEQTPAARDIYFHTSKIQFV
ncbi:MAG: glycosyltransferase family 2 protein, partial [Chloroflexi bacterium]|nr:glycosyltransferase family 2 protein [Chloroflexota bacterium]